MESKVMTAEQVIMEGRIQFYKDENADAKYENAYLLGWIKSAYNGVADELRELKRQKSKRLTIKH